jgi:hypothetical protein
MDPDPRACLKEAGSVRRDELESHHGGQRLELGDVGTDPVHLTAVLGIRHILVRIRFWISTSDFWIQIQLRIRLLVTYRMQKKINFLSYFFLITYPQVYYLQS